MAAWTCVVLCFLLSGYHVSSNPIQTYDTIVVGLGSAGTTAASTLAKAGRRVLALEAQDRVGGRVKTVPFGDGLVEEGAEWIHGTVNSRTYEEAMKHNVTIIPQDLTQEVYESDGSLGNKDLVNELVDFSLEVMGTRSTDPSESLGQYMTRRIKDYLKEKHRKVYDEDEDFVTQFLEMMNLIVNSYDASNNWNDLSSRGDYDELDGHQAMSWHRYGYKTFFEILLNTYNNGPGLPTLDVKLNKEVTSIRWPKNSTGKVEVSCKDGDVYTADNVIVTVSLGVLKERHIALFSPPLPQEKVDMIEKMSIGQVGKVILEFEKQWLPNATAILFLWRGEDRRNMSDEDYWMTQIYACSPPMGSSNTVSLWTSGDSGKLVETLPEEVLKTKIMELLRKFIGNDIKIPDPVRMIRSTWFANPYTRGSYSFNSVAMDKYPDARKVLGEALVDGAGNPKVLFAGEATNLVHYSTVHGASETGDREAKRLLNIE